MTASVFSFERAEELALDTVWSQWTELGVNGPARKHSGVGIDLEALIVATSYLATLDARLRDESLDWCATNYRLVSSDRLRNYLKTAGETMRGSFGPYAATIKKLRRVSWPADGEPFEFSPRGRAAGPDLKRPALLQLRLRAFVGVSARAEVLRWMLDQPDWFFGVLDLAQRSAYGKDNVADILDMLFRAGVVTRSTMTTAGNQLIFRLDRDSGLALALEEWSRVPLERWDLILRVMVELLQFARFGPSQPASRAVEIQRLLPALQSDLQWIGTFPTLRLGVDATNQDFDEWAMRMFRYWADPYSQLRTQRPGAPTTQT